MPNTHDTLESLLSDIADSIRAKKGSSDTIVADNFPAEIASIPTGGGTPIPEKDVNFYDYDGTVVASYTAAEFAQLTEMPPNPTHEGLTAQGWNWTLEGAKEHVGELKKLNIGQSYITDDGKTRIYIKLSDGVLLSPKLGLGINGTVVVDWGDNTTDTMTGNDINVMITQLHNYANPGDYIISLDVTGVASIFYSSTETQALFDAVYLYHISAVRIGANIRFGGSSFEGCRLLTDVTIPNNLTTLSNSPFRYCGNLRSLTIPYGISALGAYVVHECNSLESLSLPETLTNYSSATYSVRDCAVIRRVTFPKGSANFATGVIDTCISLAEITLPDTVSGFGANNFRGMTSLRVIRFKRGTPANLTSQLSPPTSCIIYIPDGTYTAYTTKTNYPNPATYVYIEEGDGFIKFNQQTPMAITNPSAFNTLPANTKIYVPTGSKSAYESATNYPDPTTYTYVGY